MVEALFADLEARHKGVAVVVGQRQSPTSRMAANHFVVERKIFKGSFSAGVSSSQK
jgi:hypothetical protein